MAINLGPGLQQLSQAVGGMASTAQAVSTQKANMAMAARQHKYNSAAILADTKLQTATYGWLKDAKTKLATGEMNAANAGDELSQFLHETFSNNSSAWFGDEELAGMFEAEALEPFIAKMYQEVDSIAIENDRKMAVNNASSAIKTGLESLSMGANPDTVYQVLTDSLAAKRAAQPMSDEVFAQEQLNLDRTFNSNVAYAAVHQVATSGAFTAEEILKIVDGINDASKIDEDTDWGKSALGIRSRLKIQDGLRPFTNDEAEALRDSAKSLMNARDSEQAKIVTEHTQTMTEHFDTLFSKDPDKLTVTAVNDYVNSDPVLSQHRWGLAYTPVNTIMNQAKAQEDLVLLSSLAKTMRDANMEATFIKEPEGKGVPTYDNPAGPVAGPKTYDTWDTIEPVLREQFRKKRPSFHSETTYDAAEDMYVETAYAKYQQGILEMLYADWDAKFADAAEKGTVIGLEDIAADERFGLLEPEFSQQAIAATYDTAMRNGLTVEARQAASYDMLLPMATNYNLPQDERKRELSIHHASLSEGQYDSLYELITRTPDSEDYGLNISRIESYVTSSVMKKDLDKMSQAEQNEYHRIAGNIKLAYNQFLMENSGKLSPEAITSWVENNLSGDVNAIRYLRHGIYDEGSWIRGKDGLDMLSLVQDGYYDKDIWPIAYGKLAEYTDSLLSDQLGINANETLAISTNTGMQYMIKASQYAPLADVYGEDSDDVNVYVQFRTITVNGERKAYPVYSVQLADENGNPVYENGEPVFQQFTLQSELPDPNAPPVVAADDAVKKAGSQMVGTGGFGPNYQQTQAMMDDIEQQQAAAGQKRFTPGVEPTPMANVGGFGPTVQQSAEAQQSVTTKPSEIDDIPEAPPTARQPSVSAAEDAARMDSKNAAAQAAKQSDASSKENNQQADDEKIVASMAINKLRPVKSRIDDFIDKNGTTRKPLLNEITFGVGGYTQGQIDAIYRTVLRERGLL